MFEITKDKIATNFNGYIVIMNLSKNYLTAKSFPLKFPGISQIVFSAK